MPRVARLSSVIDDGFIDYTKKITVPSEPNICLHEYKHKDTYRLQQLTTSYYLFPDAEVNMFYVQTPGLNIITEYVLGIIYPGRPIANVCFKVYGYMSMSQAVSFLSDFKLGHYMKIPPRSMFIVQVNCFVQVKKKTSRFSSLCYRTKAADTYSKKIE